MKPQKIILPNGLQVLFIDTKTFSTITTVLLVGAGSRYETKENNGIAHFFEHMAFKGSKKYRNSFTISSEIEGIGGVFNAFTSKDHTGYWIKTTNEHFEKVTDVLSDMVLNPLLLTEEIDREKGVIIEEINMYEDTPARRVGELFEGLLYPDHPLGFDIAGPKENIRRFNRNTFTDYMESLYQPKNAVLVVAGGMSRQVQKKSSQVNSSSSSVSEGSSSNIHSRNFSRTYLDLYLNDIVKKFGGWKNQKSLGTFSLMKDDQKKPQMLVKYKDTEQAHFCLGFRALPFIDEKKYTENVLSVILGGGMSSRLFMQVRERRGLCYYISTGREMYYDVGNLVTQAGVTNKAEKVREAVKVTLGEHYAVAEGKVTDEELKKAKELIKGRLLISLEDSSHIATSFGTKLLLENKITDIQKILKKIDEVTKENVSALAKELFIEKSLNFAIIGPFKDGDFEDLI